MGQFFKINPNLSQNWLKFRQNWLKFRQNWLKFKKILEKLSDFAQNLVQNWSEWYMNGSHFLEKLVFVWVYFQILQRYIPTKTKLEYPPAANCLLKNLFETRGADPGCNV